MSCGYDLFDTAFVLSTLDSGLLCRNCYYSKMNRTIWEKHHITGNHVGDTILVDANTHTMFTDLMLNWNPNGDDFYRRAKFVVDFKKIELMVKIKCVMLFTEILRR